MEFPKSSTVAGNFQWVAETGSTNTDLIANAQELGDFSVLIADYQSAGRGRSGRTWQAPAGSSLFVSVLLKPANTSPQRFSWLPLLAGLAMSRTVNSFLTEQQATVKWPNDVLVGEKKISGILSELVPDLSGVVIGAGLNLQQTEAELPVPTATSLKLQGVAASRDDVLAAYLGELQRLYKAFDAAAGDANQSRLRFELLQNCSSVGRRVKVVLPGDKEVFGDSLGIDDTGRLILLPDESSQIMPVAAGDVVHLRHN